MLLLVVCATIADCDDYDHVAAWVRETWPERPEFVAMGGKTSRRSHDRAAGKAAIHLGFGLCHHQPSGPRPGGLDVTFNDDQSRVREGFGARNMAVVRHFALNLARAAKDTKSVKLRHELAAWTTSYLGQLFHEQIR